MSTSQAFMSIRTELGAIHFHDDGTYTLSTDGIEPGAVVPFAESAQKHVRSLAVMVERGQGLEGVHSKLDRLLERAVLRESNAASLVADSTLQTPATAWVDRWKVVPPHKVSSPFPDCGRPFPSEKQDKLIRFLYENARLIQHRLPNRELPRFMLQALPGEGRTYDMMHVYSMELVRQTDSANWAVWTQVGNNAHLQLLMLSAQSLVMNMNPEISMVQGLLYHVIEAERERLPKDGHIFVDVAFLNQPVPWKETQGPWDIFAPYLKMLGGYSVLSRQA